MKKFLVIIFTFGVLSLIGCGPAVRSEIKPENIRNVLSRKEPKSFLVLTYYYKDKPYGFRVYGLVYSLTNKKQDYLVYFGNKDKKDIVLIDIKPGTCFLKSVTYQGQLNGKTYGQFPIYTNITVDPDVVYYLGSFEIFKVTNTNSSKMFQYVNYSYVPMNVVGASVPVHKSGGTTVSAGFSFGIDIDGLAAEARQFDGMFSNNYSEDTNLILSKFKELNGYNISNVTLKPAYTN